MRYLIIFILICAGCIFWFSHIFQTGKLQKYLDEHPGPTWNVKIQYYIARYHDLKKEYQPSLDAYERVLNVYPKTVYAEKALYMKGKNLEALMRKEEAQEAFKLFLETYPQSDKAELANQKYRRLQGY